MKTKDYYRKVAEDLRLLFVGRTLLSNTTEKIEVRRTKKSPNKISVYINQRHEVDITIIKYDKFIVQLTPKRWHDNLKLNNIEELYDLITDRFI